VSRAVVAGKERAAADHASDGRACGSGGGVAAREVGLGIVEGVSGGVEVEPAAVKSELVAAEGIADEVGREARLHSSWRGLCPRKACFPGAFAEPSDPVLLDFSNRRVAQKAKFGGELFIANSAATQAGTRFVDFFQQDKTTGEAKGILSIDLGGLT
jgi:hypothetical protein